MNPLRVLLIAPDPLARAALASFLDVDALVVVGQADGSAEWDDLIELYTPDVILCDVGWQMGLDVPSIRELNVACVALVPDKEAATAVWSMGARAVLERGVSAEILTSALIAASNGLITLSPTLLPDPINPELALQQIEPLTQRELDVLNLLATGMTNRAIALRLAISDHTVKFHVNALMTKLNAQSRTEAAVKATRLGLLSI